MKKKLLRGNILLIIVTCLLVANSIVMEYIHGKEFLGFSFTAWMCMHVILGLMWALAVYWHLYLHNWGSILHWPRKISRLRNKANKVLAWFYLLLLLTGIAATVCTILTEKHTHLGGIHGKIGFLAAILMFLHLLKHRNWFSNRTDGKKRCLYHK